jgi:hypothetical protein
MLYVPRAIPKSDNGFVYCRKTNPTLKGQAFAAKRTLEGWVQAAAYGRTR